MADGRSGGTHFSFHLSYSHADPVGGQRVTGLLTAGEGIKGQGKGLDTIHEATWFVALRLTLPGEIRDDLLEKEYQGTSPPFSSFLSSRLWMS